MKWGPARKRTSCGAGECHGIVSHVACGDRGKRWCERQLTGVTLLFCSRKKTGWTLVSFRKPGGAACSWRSGVARHSNALCHGRLAGVHVMLGTHSGRLCQPHVGRHFPSCSADIPCRRSRPSAKGEDVWGFSNGCARQGSRRSCQREGTLAWKTSPVFIQIHIHRHLCPESGDGVRVGARRMRCLAMCVPVWTFLRTLFLRICPKRLPIFLYFL